MREKIVEDVPVYNPIISNPSWLSAGGFGAASSDPKDFNVSEEDTLLEEDPNKGKKGFHFDAASGKWVPDTSASEEDPNKDKKGFHLDPATGKWVPDVSGGSKKVLKSTYTDPTTGDIIDIYDNGDGTTSETVRKKGTLVQDAEAKANAEKAAQKAARQSAYDLLYAQFEKYGLQSLVEPLKGLIESGASPAEFALRLRNDSSINPTTGRPWNEAYQKRFAGNAQRIAKGLTALDEATYLAKEDAYQNIMRNYGLPDTYWKVGDLGTQEGFTKLIANDVSAVELEDRIATAQQRVLNSNPEVLQTLKQFYPDISNADILAYALDPKNALENIKRKVTAAEIGGAALQQGLQANGGTAESLAAQGITKAQAQQGYATVADIAPRGSELAAIYGESPYGQQQAEAEVFNTAGAAEAKKKRQKLVGKEIASFSGASGVGALGRDRANAYGTTQSGYGQY